MESSLIHGKYFGTVTAVPFIDASLSYKVLVSFQCNYSIGKHCDM